VFPVSGNAEVMMRILQVNKLYHPWIGGIETVAQDIAEHFHQRNGYSVTNLVCQPSGKRKTESVNGVPTYRAASWGIFSGMPISFDFFYLFSKLAKEADLIILHHPFPLAFVAYRFFGHRRKTIVWYHSDIVKQIFTKIPFLPFIRYALRRADLIFVSNRAIARNSSTLRDCSDKCKVVYFGIDDRKFSRSVDVDRQVEEVRRTYGNSLVLSVGRLVYYKGYQYLIEAMKDVPDANLLIIGKGKLHAQLRAQIEALDLTKRVHIIDPVENLVPYYCACDVFAFPSCEPSEVFGIVQLEAMACGKPVVNTNLPTGVPEVSIDNKTGKTVPAKDSAALASALNEVLSNKNEYERLAGNALREVASRFTREKFLLEMEKNIASSFDTRRE
jgi:glycosyltransferase involved in cell wall biosynthesis